MNGEHDTRIHRHAHAFPFLLTMKEYACTVSARALPDCLVRVEFDNGAAGVFDCKPFLDDPVRKRLSDPAFFRLVRAECGTLAWPGDIDIAPEDVWDNTRFDEPARVAEEEPSWPRGGTVA